MPEQQIDEPGQPTHETTAEPGHDYTAFPPGIYSGDPKAGTAVQMVGKFWEPKQPSAEKEAGS